MCIFTVIILAIILVLKKIKFYLYADWLIVFHDISFDKVDKAWRYQEIRKKILSIDWQSTQDDVRRFVKFDDLESFKL